MNLSAVLPVLLLSGFLSDEPIDSLFSVLDRNQDGKIVSDEVAEPQRPFFQRALRVADRDENGALTHDEFTTALSDPEPFEPPGASAAGRAADFDLKSLDRNADGKLSVDEVPAPLKDRFQKILDRIGNDTVELDKVRAYLGGDRGENSETGKSTKSGKPDTDADSMMMTTGDAAEGLQAIVRRLDADGNGRVDRKEQQRFPQLAVLLDRNRDGQISTDELKLPDLPNPAGDAVKSPEKGRRKGAPDSSSLSAKSLPGTFSQLDQNGDGQLSGAEIPTRMRQNLQMADSNKDGRISQAEFAAALKRRLQQNKK